MEDLLITILNWHFTLNIPAWVAFIAIALPCVFYYLQRARRLQMKESTHEPAQWYEVSVSEEEKMLPRYKYHLSLLNDWIKKGVVELIPESNEWMTMNCCIMVGGNIDMQQKNTLFKDFKPKKIALNDFKKDFQRRNVTDVLIVYYFNTSIPDLNREMQKIKEFISFCEGTVLFAVKNVYINNDNLKEDMKKEAEFSGFSNVHFVEESRSQIINEMTCILENKIAINLKNIRRSLLEISHPRRVSTSLLKVEALIMRLKKATNPTSITDEDKNITFTTTGDKKVDDLLQRFHGRILYQKYDGRELYVIVKDENTKKKLEDLFKAEIMDLKVIIERKLPVSTSANKGTPLHGAKFVYRNDGETNFHNVPSYATTGSLMVANGDSFVVITSRHAFDSNEFVPIYTLIDNQLHRLGVQIPQLQNNMEYLHEDITLVRVDETVRKIVDEKCEKLLIHRNEPFPAKISTENLELGDIVHKRGATTELTTGIVTNLNIQTVGTFCKPSVVIFITGDKDKPFADNGDSGSLVYKTSLSSEEITLEVHAMVHGKVARETLDGPPDTICFPIKDGCKSLYDNIFLLRSLKFCDQ